MGITLSLRDCQNICRQAYHLLADWRLKARTLILFYLASLSPHCQMVPCLPSHNKTQAGKTPPMPLRMEPGGQCSRQQNDFWSCFVF
jgi:hypothetical protein